MIPYPDKAANEKSKLRKQFRTYRRTLTEGDYARRSAAMVERIFALPEIGCARLVHAYWPMTRRHEPDIRSLIVRLREQGVAIALPLVPDIDVPSMYAVRYTGEEPSLEPPWGIPRPTGSEQVPSHRIDTVIVPMLGGARDGHRIGYGKGYYDTFLQDIQAVRIGVTYQACLIDSIFSEPHDIRMDILVTEEQVLRTEDPV